jgi:hypothetical protein
MAQNTFANFYMSRSCGGGSVLGLSMLTTRRAAAAGLSQSDSNGYFLYEAKACDPESIEIIARVASDEAALRLKELLGLD